MQAHHPLVKTIGTSLKRNSYWMSLISFLQFEEHPKDFSCIQKIDEYYASLTLSDLFLLIDNCIALNPMFTSTGATKYDSLNQSRGSEEDFK